MSSTTSKDMVLVNTTIIKTKEPKLSYYQKHKDTIKIKNKLNYENNKDKIREMNKALRQKIDKTPEYYAKKRNQYKKFYENRQKLIKEGKIIISSEYKQHKREIQKKCNDKRKQLIAEGKLQGGIKPIEKTEEYLQKKRDICNRSNAKRRRLIAEGKIIITEEYKQNKRLIAIKSYQKKKQLIKDGVYVKRERVVPVLTQPDTTFV